MIWAILAAVGVPLWLCAVGISALVWRNRALRHRTGNVPVRMRAAGHDRWVPGHALWVNDVLAFRGSPAAWKEALLWTAGATSREPTEAERKKLHRLGSDPVVVDVALRSGEPYAFACRAEHAATLLGPSRGRDAAVDVPLAPAAGRSGDAGATP
jgi:hypothetical protein